MYDLHFYLKAIIAGQFYHSYNFIEVKVRLVLRMILVLT